MKRFAILILFCSGFTTLFAQENQIDRFMSQVFQNRDQGYAQLTTFSFIEDQVLTITNAQTGKPLLTQNAQYEWSGIEGLLVRLPLTINNVTVPEKEKAKYKTTWLTQGRAGKRRADLTSDSFFHFSFEPGRYFLKKRFNEGQRDLIEIEYYPEIHFQNNGRDPIGTRGDKYDSSFDKTSVITYTIDFDNKQIVKIEFSNTDLDFLPFGWLAKLENLDATITYTQLGSGEIVPAIQRMTSTIVDADSTKNIVLVRVFHDYVKPKVNVQFQLESPNPQNN